jgi:hypothetical protein
MPIISLEDFTAVQKILNKYKGARTTKPLDNPLEADELSNRHTKIVNGESKVAVPIYGYAKADSGGLAIDEPAAEVVRKMFLLAAEGKTTSEIAEILAAKQVPKPNEYKKLAKGQRITPTCAWTAGNVEGIIFNIQYTGAYVSGRILKDRETGKSYHDPQADWIIIPEMNPAIVNKELYDEVQAAIAAKRYKRNKTAKRDNLLRGGTLKCGCFGYAMSYDGISAPVYRCYHTTGTLDAECHKLKVSVRELDETILTVIRKQAEVILNSGYFAELRKVGDNGKRIADFEKEVSKCVEERQRAYEQFVTRAIDRDTYVALKTDSSERIEKLNNQIAVSKQAERDRLSGVKTTAIAKDIVSETLEPR